MKKIAIFGSGSGSNAEKICSYFAASTNIKVACIFTNKKSAFIAERAIRLNIPLVYTTKKELELFKCLNKKLKKYNVDYIVLAGFLLKISCKMINAYSKKIINLHPSLLPKYGGKGMYGKNVHSAVLKNREKESGITIHFVNENYDEGEIIFQKKCPICNDETPESLEKKIRLLEFAYFPKIIKNTILK